MEELTPMLAARGYDIKADEILQSRAAKFVGPACNVAPDLGAQLAKNMDQLKVVARNVAVEAERQFLDELATRPVPPHDATGGQRYGPNWQAVESLIESLSDWMPTEDWQAIIGGSMSLRHPAMERMKNLKAQAQYAAGQKGRELGLDDQIAFAQADISTVMQQAAGSTTFLQACGTLRLTQAQAASTVRLDATSAVQALVIGSDNMDTPFYAALCSPFVKQILGEEEYERTQLEFRKASEGLGET
jgi:hypothetical protein